METFKTKEIPVATESKNMGSAKQYYTAEEAIAFMEPRIRAMFK